MPDREIVRSGRVVEINYVLRGEDGVVVDDTEGNPMPYLHGHGTLVPGLEKALEGKTLGARFTLELKPDEAFGPRDEALQEEVSRDQMVDDWPLEVGDLIMTEGADGGDLEGTIAALSDDAILIDFNHPLAGETVTYDVEVVGMREPTKAEAASGDVVDPYAD